MTTKKILISSALVAMLAPAAAFAQQAAYQQPGFYAGGKVGAASTDDRFIDRHDTSYGVYGGYRFNPYFAVEGEYTNFGNLTVRLSDLETWNPGVEPRTWGLRAVGFMPVADNFELLGSVGYHAFDINPQDGQGFRDAIGNSSASDWFYGVGGQFNFANNLSLRAQYQRYEFKSAGRSDEISLGLHFRF